MKKIISQYTIDPIALQSYSKDTKDYINQKITKIMVENIIKNKLIPITEIKKDNSITLKSEIILESSCIVMTIEEYNELKRLIYFLNSSPLVDEINRLLKLT